MHRIGNQAVPTLSAGFFAEQADQVGEGIDRAAVRMKSGLGSGHRNRDGLFLVIATSIANAEDGAVFRHDPSHANAEHHVEETLFTRGKPKRAEPANPGHAGSVKQPPAQAQAELGQPRRFLTVQVRQVRVIGALGMSPEIGHKFIRDRARERVSPIPAPGEQSGVPDRIVLRSFATGRCDGGRQHQFFSTRIARWSG